VLPCPRQFKHLLPVFSHPLLHSNLRLATSSRESRHDTKSFLPIAFDSGLNGCQLLFVDEVLFWSSTSKEEDHLASLFSYRTKFASFGDEGAGWCSTRTCSYHHYQLLKSPVMMKKLVEEPDAALEDEEGPVAPYDRVKHLPYLRACLDESLRLFPSTPHALPRETKPEGSYILDDYIAGGVSVGMSALVAHRNEGHFPQVHP
jgi:hypothetical protein